MFVFNPNLGQLIEGVALLVSIGINGVYVSALKQQKLDRYVAQCQIEANARLIEENEKLQKNQKPEPWNKGKKGYKLSRKPKEQTYVLSDNPIVAKWKETADGTVEQTAYPTWTVIAPKSELYQEVFGE